MNVNEIVANRALQLLGHPPGSYDIIDPIDDANIFQSTVITSYSIHYTKLYDLIGVDS